MNPSTEVSMTPAQARAVMKKLQDQGVLSLDQPASRLVDNVGEALGDTGMEAGWYVLFGSGCCLVVL